MEALKHLIFGHPIISFTDGEAKEKGKGFYYKGQEYVHHSSLHHAETAFHVLSRPQTFFLLIALIATTACFVANWHLSLVVAIAMLTILYFSDLLFNLYLIFRSFSKPAEVKIKDEEIQSRLDWPKYSILCPLYKESAVISQFVDSMKKIDYPSDKLQIMLLLEEDDTESIEKIKRYFLPFNFELVIVPHSKPKTKPKACNYGLQLATGDYVVIYDAEDIPEPLQLKKAVLAFEKSNERVKCIQAKLNFYNPTQNLLSRVFTAEYSLWFELILTGLQSIHAPIPLGGTSNHFRKTDLLQLGGWDSFNVTEDCDLGMRLVKRGYQTAIIESLTLEEANTNSKNWIEQRTRWIKGYMQTYLLHMRKPQEFMKDWKEPHILTFQLVVGGKILSLFINPLMWMLTIAYFLFRLHIGTFIQSFFPEPVLFLGLISIFIGNFLYLYYYIIGCIKHGHDGLVKYALFVPFYWLAMSVAAWIAFYRLILTPHHWSKTKHGLHLVEGTPNSSLPTPFFGQVIAG